MFEAKEAKNHLAAANFGHVIRQNHDLTERRVSLLPRTDLTFIPASIRDFPKHLDPSKCAVPVSHPLSKSQDPPVHS